MSAEDLTDIKHHYQRLVARATIADDVRVTANRLVDALVEKHEALRTTQDVVDGLSAEANERERAAGAAAVLDARQALYAVRQNLTRLISLEARDGS
jgi:hypothetical protein